MRRPDDRYIMHGSKYLYYGWSISPVFWRRAMEMIWHCLQENGESTTRDVTKRAVRILIAEMMNLSFLCCGEFPLLHYLSVDDSIIRIYKPKSKTAHSIPSKVNALFSMRPSPLLEPYFHLSSLLAKISTPSQTFPPPPPSPYSPLPPINPIFPASNVPTPHPSTQPNSYLGRNVSISE